MGVAHRIRKDQMTYIETSKQQWDHGNTTTADDIKTGCLQRIATAVEAIAINYNQLLSENKRLNERAEFWLSRCERAEKRAAAYKGMAKLNRKIK